MTASKNIFSRIGGSIRDGSFINKIANRISAASYAPAIDSAFIRNFHQHNPDIDLRHLSDKAKKLFIELRDLFEKIDIKTIAYVGANDGNVALAINEAFPGMVFYLFEPIPETYKILCENVSGCDNMHTIHTAIGSDDGYAEMYMDEFLPASSMLPMEEKAIEEFSYLGKQEKVKVRVMPMDTALVENRINQIDFLIMDIQGYEDELLKGAGETLKTCKAVMSELSLEQLYTDSSTFDSVYQALAANRFSLQYLIGPLYGKSGRILQVDGIFVKTSV